MKASMDTFSEFENYARFRRSRTVTFPEEVRIARQASGKRTIAIEAFPADGLHFFRKMQRLASEAISPDG
jgi:predicted RNase H-like nuclease